MLSYGLSFLSSKPKINQSINQSTTVHWQVGMSQSGFFFYPDPNLSLLIFSKCRYRVPIRYLALTNIFLDNTAALRKKVPTSKLFLNRFLLFCWNKVYFHMALSYSSYVSVTLRCDSRPSYTASWSVCKTQPTLGTSISSNACFIFLTLSHEMTSISHAFSISLIACFTCMRPTKLVRRPGSCHVML